MYHCHILFIRLSECTPCSHVGVVWYLSMWLPSHCLYLCMLLFQRKVHVGVAGKCGFSEGGLLIGGLGCWGRGGGVMAGWALAGHQRFCSGIRNVRRLGGGFWKILHKCSIFLLY
jgi:hypothetical protein